jgi:hypothetical protein
MPLKLDPEQEGGRHYLDLASKYLSKDPLARHMLENLNVEVRLNFHGATQVVNENGVTVIMWDPTAALVVKTPDGAWQVQSPALGLLHEVIHVYMGKQIRSQADLEKFEQEVTEIEAAIGKLLGEPVRLKYDDGIKIVKVSNPTAHTQEDKWFQQEPDGSVSVDPYTGNPYVIPKLAPLGPINIGGGGGGGSGGAPGVGDWGFYTPEGIGWIDPSLPRGDVDVIPGAVAPSPIPVDTGIDVTPAEPFTVVNEKVSILVGVPIEQAM